MPESYDFNIYQGDNFSLGITVKDDAGIPLNLSGYSARGIIKLNYSSTGLQTLSCNFIQPESGALTVSLLSTETANLPPTQLLYDVEAYNSGETDVFKVLRGYFNVFPEVTHA